MSLNEVARSAAIGLGFAAAAALARHTFLTVETRIQIVIFIVLAVIHEWLVRPAIGQRSQFLSASINAGLAAAAILATRWHLEGLCPGVKKAACFPFS